MPLQHKGRKPTQLLTVVFMGDSITEGQFISPPHRWVDIVSSELVKSYLDSSLNIVFVTKEFWEKPRDRGLSDFPRMSSRIRQTLLRSSSA